jgi:hypothetical protein
MDLNAIIKRTSNIIIKPAEEWQVISQEKTSKKDVISGFALPYIIVVAIASVAGSYLFSFGFFSSSYIILSALIAFVVPFLGIFISAYIINALAPSFGSVSNIDNSFKLVIYSYTASFLASIITGFLPVLFFIGIAGLYSFYIFWLGFTPMMKTPDDKKAGYAIISILIMIGVYGILSISLGLILASFFITGAAFHI